MIILIRSWGYVMLDASLANGHDRVDDLATVRAHLDVRPHFVAHSMSQPVTLMPLAFNVCFITAVTCGQGYKFMSVNDVGVLGQDLDARIRDIQATKKAHVRQ
jgi:hypothetical protein